ncbi:MAG TPA: cytochrome c oxidase assembly protein, partial [Anaerolineae bacterium]|nr:cytochrome c oxidase assembly protein [Anaerolineae bacterium]
LFLGSALLFWWPVIGADPSPHRMGYGGRILYLAVGMPLSSFLGLVIYSAPSALYDHYVTLVRDWGPTPLQDQQWAGLIMWAGGDAAFVLALVLTVAAWIRHEERQAVREDARLARRRTAADKASALPPAVTAAPGEVRSAAADVISTTVMVDAAVMVDRSD